MAGENKQIYQLTSRTFDGDSIIPFDRPNTDPSTMAEKPYLSGNCNGHDVTDFVANTEEYTTDLDTTAKTITGAINELNGSIGVDAYDDTATYAVGDLCIYNNTLYKCTTAITTAEAWNASHWTATSIADELANKANASNTYTKTQVDNALNNKQDKLNKGTLGSTVDLDTLFANSVYYLAGATTTQHAPCSYGMLEVINATLTLQRVTQVGASGTSNSQYERLYINNAWTTWKLITRS